MLRKSALKEIINDDLIGLWNVLTHEDKLIILSNFSIQNFRKNQIIYAENDDPENLWILLNGKVKIYKNGVGDRPQILRLFRPIQYFGYRAYFARENYVSNAAAFETSTLGYIPMEVIEKLILHNNELAMFFIHELARTLGGSDTKIVNLTQKHVRGRLAEALMILKDKYGLEDDEQTLRIHMSREDLANMSNMTTSNAIRTLSMFVNEKLIVVDGRRIKILKESQMRKIAKFG